MDAIFDRVSVRKYEDRKVEAEKIEKLLRAGMAAPSAGNQQPWAFCVTENAEIMEQLVKVSPYTTPLNGAPLCIAVLYKKGALRHKDYVDQDLSAATQNILLEAEYLGLGAVWMGIAPLKERMDGAKAVLELSDDYEVFALIAVGYAKERQPKHDRYEESRVSWR